VLCYYDDAPSEGATEPLYSSKLKQILLVLVFS